MLLRARSSGSGGHLLTGDIPVFVHIYFIRFFPENQYIGADYQELAGTPRLDYRKDLWRAWSWTLNTASRIMLSCSLSTSRNFAA